MLALFAAMCTLVIGPVTLWSGETIPRDRVEGVNDQGVELRQQFGEGEVVASTLVPWGDVRSISNAWQGAAEYKVVADAIKRAEERLARGDSAGAGWLLEPLADRYLSAEGPTTSQSASALVMIRVLSDDRAGAFRAWFVWRTNRAGPSRPWLDAETGLCPALPPVFAGPAVGDRSAWPDGVMAGIYRAAALQDQSSMGDALASIERGARDRADPGIRFVWDIVRSRTEADPTARRAAREAIDRRGRAADEPWQSAWAHLGVGVSLLGESDPQLRDSGAARLISVIIEHPNVAPGLTGLARDLLIEYFESTGRPQHAESVRAMDRAALLGLEPGLRSRSEQAATDQRENRELTPGQSGLPRENP